MMPTASDLAAAKDVAAARTGRWWLVALLVSGMIFCCAQRGTLSVAAPFMIRELGITTETMGLMLSAFSWFYCVTTKNLPLPAFTAQPGEPRQWGTQFTLRH